MAIDFEPGLVTCVDCVRGPGAELSEGKEDLDELNACVEYVLGYEAGLTAANLDRVPVGRFACASMIASGFCPEYKVGPGEHFEHRTTCGVSLEHLKAMAEAKKAA